MPVSPSPHDIVEQCEESLSVIRLDPTLGQSSSEVVRKGGIDHRGDVRVPESLQIAINQHDTAPTTRPADNTISSQLARAQISLNTNGGETTGPFFNHPSDFVINNPIMVSNTYHNVKPDKKTLKILLKYTILGADFDSSERDPPPRCHPETRVALRERLKKWIVNLEPKEKSFIWLKGPAGVGKSAVMQTISEFLFGNEDSDQVAPGASFFFWRGDSSGDRNDSSRLFTTIAYQLATRCNSYRDYLLSELAHDPKLPERAMKTQFSHFITRPFSDKNIYSKTQPITIIVDGLDECRGEREQCEIIQLIASFVTNHPTAPLLWLVSSRPESHLEAMFARPNIVTTYKTEEILISSNESCADVERYLRSEFTEIRLKNPLSIPTSYQWPTESQFLTVAGGAGGLFAFATTVIRFIDDPDYKDPRTLLDQVVGVIENVNKDEQNLVFPAIKRNPFVNLDALYTFIMSTVPEDIFPITKKLLLVIRDKSDVMSNSFMVVVNFLQITTHQALGALHKLNSLLRYDTDLKRLPTLWHKSFNDFLEDKSRSAKYFMSRDDMEEEYRLNIRRIQCEVINGQYKIENITLTCPDETKFSNINDRFIRLGMLSVMLRCVTEFWYTRTPSEYQIESELLFMDWKIHPDFSFFSRVLQPVRYFHIAIKNRSIMHTPEEVYRLCVKDVQIHRYGLLATSSVSDGTAITTDTAYDITRNFERLNPNDTLWVDEKCDTFYAPIVSFPTPNKSLELDAFWQKLGERNRLVEPHQSVLMLETLQRSPNSYFIVRNYITIEDSKGESILWDLLITYIW